MQTDLKISIDSKTKMYVEKYAQRKGFSINEMLEYYLKWIVWNEEFSSDFVKKETETKNNWDNLENFLSKNRFNLPENYTFNRSELHER